MQIYPDEKEMAEKLQMRHSVPVYSISQLQQSFGLVSAAQIEASDISSQVMLG